MPLYEMILISRAGKADRTGKLLKYISKLVDQKGGVTRSATVLGDRIMSRTVTGNDHKDYIVGIHCLFL